MIVVAHRVICDGFVSSHTARETPLFSLLGYLWSLSSRKARCDVIAHRSHPSFLSRNESDNGEASKANKQTNKQWKKQLKRSN
jgi:hypothetical protein